MGKYDKLFPKMTEKQKRERINIIKAEYDKARKKHDEERIGAGSFVSEEMRTSKAWMKIGADPLITAMVGPFSVAEMMELLGMEYPDLDRESLIKAMDACMGVTRFEIKEGKGSIFTVDFSDKMKADMKAFEEKNEKYLLTRWDKFLGFFGIKTDHARAVETSIAALEAYREKRQELNKKVVISQLSQGRRLMLDKTKPALDRMKEIAAGAKGRFAGWNTIFFDGKKPNDYILDNGKKVSAFSLCMAIMHQRTEYDFSDMSPKQFADLMEKDEKLREEVKAVGTKISEMIANKEAAGDKETAKSFDKELKDMLKPQNPRRMYLSRSVDYIRMGRDKAAEKREIFSNTCVAIKVMDDMAKIFGKDDMVYGNKNAIDKNVEEQIKKLLIKTNSTVNLYEALAKENYDTALKLSPEGKNDYTNLEAVINQCERTINRFEAEYNGQPVKTQPIMEEQPVDDIELDSVL